MSEIENESLPEVGLKVELFRLNNQNSKILNIIR